MPTANASNTATMTSRKPQRNGSSVSLPEFNIALLGVLGVGKSALTVKYLTRRYIMEYDPYMEDTYTKHECIDAQEIIVRIMDTYDREGSDPERYLRWADGIIVVYSITSRQSYEEARNYICSVLNYQNKTTREIPLALVGNKMDLERYRQVSKAEGSALATEQECLFYETTAAEDYQCVETVFHGIVKEIQREKERQMPLQPLFITEDKPSGSISLGPGSTGSLQRPGFRRAKSPKSEARSEKDSARGVHKKSVPSFRIFNKSFKIFN
ncbi:ras-like protein family member 12 [Lingula anatina]|uniref:small monomeric GTPase n=1 Tax=Lingula anatina TaxID=7574 RepID=A0A1S3HXW0_LINAN|nr:ras-like protein family member 12 [Lingula anatina]|eukprot:XP_013389909.1 ras-like protein family member 12 [Lingula anatina]